MDLYFKVLPKGMSDFKGILIGYPALESLGYGLGHQVTDQTHYFSALEAHTPRVELRRRQERDAELEQWLETGDYVSKVTDSGSRLQELCLSRPWKRRMCGIQYEL